MSKSRVIRFADAPAEAEEYYLPAEKLISGNPKQTAWTHYADPTGRFFAGFWHSEVGKWKISYTEEEFCEMLEGTSVITDARGHAVTVSAGERFVIPRGFVGTWEVVVPSKKLFAIYEPGA
jgi:uncharacterized cupin superfamily protein